MSPCTNTWRGSPSSARWFSRFAFGKPTGNHDEDGRNALYGDGHVGFEKNPFVGVQRDVAQTLLESLGMTFVPVEVPSDAPTGTVVGQTPQPGTTLGTGDNVTLVVSKGPLR